ncbi:helix-turn-helix transcriptional regulator [Streptomyces sp. 4N509B]|uniref:helix-turn-helix transcriptional regulator n=1 Tax=Streptomyces sp. 4N509B TaxID=3457413 RepID=UPI003FD11C90
MLVDVESSNVSPVFVGRGGELAVLADGLARAREGEPQVFVVGGDAGIGKTRLLEEFLATARAAGAVTAVGGCVELGADGLPFAPLAAVLRSLHRQLGPELAEAAAGQEGVLARIHPELGRVAPVADAQLERVQLFELTARLLERLAAERLLVVAVEDLHWSDRSTRELLGYLFRSFQPSRLLVLVTYRSDDIHRRHPLRPFLAELDRVRTVRRIELARLTREEVAAQIAGITGTAPPPGTARSVFERSQGIPFFVEELTTSGQPTAGLSAPLRELLLVRVEALDEDAQDVVRTVAEGGSSVEHGLLAAVAGRPERELLALLRAAVDANVLVATSEGDGYRFRHALMRDAVVDDLLPGERTHLHRRFAEALERHPHLVPAEQHAARLASHWFQAGDHARALPAVLTAAVSARRRYAYAEQLTLLERAMTLWESVPPEVRDGLRPVDRLTAYPVREDQPLDEVDLLAEATLAGVLSEQMGRALAASRRALRTLDEAAEPLRAAWFLTYRARIGDLVGQVDGQAELERAAELLRGLPPSAVHAQVQAQAAALRTMTSAALSPGTFEAAERAVSLARLVGTKSTELYARMTLSCLRTDAGDIEGGLTEMAAVLDEVVARHETGQLGRTLVNFAATLAEVGDLERGLEITARGMDLADRYDLADTRGWLGTNKAYMLLNLGRWDEAAATLTAARQQARSVNPRVWTTLMAGRLALLRGDLDGVRTALANGQDARLDSDRGLALELARLEIALASEEGDLDRAREAFHRAVDAPIPAFVSSLRWELLFTAAGAEADGRGLPGAEPGRPAALREIRHALQSAPRNVPLRRAFGHLVDAELISADGGDSAARWAEAVSALEPLELPYHLAWARYRWAEALLTTEGAAGREPASEPLRRAHAVAAALGAAPLRERIERLAVRAGLDLAEGRTASAPPPADPFGLTRREREVLALVAAGRSNRQIAQELFISPKTASVHVSNILAKLAVSGRGEAAALAHRLRLVPAVPAAPPPEAAGPSPASRPARTPQAP